MELLPLALVSEILMWAHGPELLPSPIPHDLHTDFAKVLTQPTITALQSLAGVCTTWQAIVHKLCLTYQSTTLDLVFTIGQEEHQLVEWADQLRIIGPRISDLQIGIISSSKKHWWEISDGDNSSTQPEWIDWEQVFMHFPNIIRLDLSKIPLYHFSLGEIMDVASVHCRKVQALILPIKDRIYSDAVDATIDDTFQKLYRAIERWYDTTLTYGKNNGSLHRGLRQLTVPSRNEFDREGTSHEFLTNVVKFCPMIEYLDGWKRTFQDTRLVVSDENWCVSPEVWNDFCRVCVSLREFSWVIVPFADTFFVPFGQTPKPALTCLQLTYNAKAPFRIRRSEYSTEGLCSLLEGCPALEILDIVLHRFQPSDAFVYPHLDEMIDAKVFNDDFVLTLVKNCPRLQRLRIRDLGKATIPVQAITGCGLQALASLPRLRLIDIHNANCSTDGILSFLRSSKSSWAVPPEKQVQIRDLSTKFGDVVHDLLNLLTSSKVDRRNQVDRDLQSPVYISLGTRRGFVFKKEVIATFRCKIIAQYTHLRFAFVMMDKKRSRRETEVSSRALNRLFVQNNVFRAGKFVLYTQKASLSQHMCALVECHRDTWIIDE